MFWYLSQTKSSAKITIPLLRVRWLNSLPLAYVSPLKIHVAPSVSEILTVLLFFSPMALPYQNEFELDRISSILFLDWEKSQFPTSNDPIILTFLPFIYCIGAIVTLLTYRLFCGDGCATISIFWSRNGCYIHWSFVCKSKRRTPFSVPPPPPPKKEVGL